MIVCACVCLSLCVRSKGFILINFFISLNINNSDMTTLKNAQDLDRSTRMKDLAKGFKDPDELAQHRRRENKKHVEQSVEERQKVKGFCFQCIFDSPD